MEIKPDSLCRSPKSRCPVWVVLFFLVLSACASQTGQVRSRSWTCDPEADAAFERGDWPTALAGHEHLLAADPSNGLALYHLGYILGKLGHREQEVAAYQLAIDTGYNQDDQLFFNLGMSLADLGQVDEAEKALQKATAIKPQNADNHFGLGIILQALGKLNQAQEAFIKAEEIDPHLWEARLALARLYLDQSRWEQAERELEAVLEGDPENEEAQELWQILESRQSTQYE